MRRRTVSLELAASGGEPHRAHPHAGRAQRVDDLRPQDHRADVAGVPAGFRTLGDDDVHAVGGMALSMFGRAGQRSHRHPGRVRLVDDVIRRGAQRVGDQLDRVLERDVDV
jgi:hypothetical protein